MSTEPPIRYDEIYLFSADNPLAGALSYVFEREVCSKCTIVRNGDSVSFGQPDRGRNKMLFMIDCLERDFEKELLELAFEESLRPHGVAVALFNLQKGTRIERKAFNKGIRGFFYRNDSLVQVLKGIRAIFQGEIWASREVLTEVALQNRLRKSELLESQTALTRREIQILALLSIGSSNDEIAEKLFISTNTVKTHLYRTFRKIKVPNRFQAALWAAKNL